MTMRADKLESLARAAAEIRRRDVEVMANFSAFPRFLWSDAKNSDIVFSKVQIRDAYRKILAEVEAEKLNSTNDESLVLLAEAIIDFLRHASAICDRYIDVANTMDAIAVRHPIRAFIAHFRKIRAIHREEKIMDEAARRIKFYWPCHQ